MANNKQQQQEVEKKDLKYFKTLLHGLRFSVGEDKYIQFKTHTVSIHGDKVKIGYLVTSDPKAIKLCKSDYNVKEISEKTYKLETEG